MLGWFNGETVIDEATYEALFAPDFKASVSFAQLTPVVDQMRQLGPWEFDQVLGESAADGAYRLSSEAGDRAVLNININDDDLVYGLSVVPWTAPVGSFEEALEQLDEFETSTLLVAEVSDGECSSITERNVDEVQPLGSIFKLYVLGALLDAIDAGSVTWDQPVIIRDELDSYPSGTTQDVEAGIEMTVQELAELMIAISDNTATDHLIELLGREAVEAAQANYGQSNPELNQPFLTTRELFLLKTDDDLRATYVAGDRDDRRAMLDSLAGVALPPVEEVLSFVEGGALDVEVVEWFATPTDMCRLLVEVAKDPVAREMLAINPGVPDDTGRWSYIGFKGGSEPGVVALAWLLEDADGRVFTVTGGITSSTPVSEIEVGAAFAGLRDQFEAPAS